LYIKGEYLLSEWQSFGWQLVGSGGGSSLTREHSTMRMHVCPHSAHNKIDASTFYNFLAIQGTRG